MAIEKMSLMRIVGSTESMNNICRELIYLNNVHLDFDLETVYNNYFAMHEYESSIIGFTDETKDMHINTSQNEINKCIEKVENLSNALELELSTNEEIMFRMDYNFENAHDDLAKIETSIGEKIDQINSNKKEIEKLTEFVKIIDSISDKEVKAETLSDLNFFEFEIGTLSSENTWRLKKRYENFSAIIFRIGNIDLSVEDLYMVIYPKQLREETSAILKSLSWNKLVIPKGIEGSPVNMVSQANKKIESLKQDIDSLMNSIRNEKESDKELLYKIYNFLVLENKVVEVVRKAKFGNNIFALDAWVANSDVNKVEDAISKISDNYKIKVKAAEEIGDDTMPPTKLKNNWLLKPFELIVKMYGLPAYNELDPTPFLAISYCLAFGIMFGDIGQGFIYFLAGVLLRKKIGLAGDLLVRLGIMSMIFGCVYGSFFGLEKHELPWLPSLVAGGPLNADNIPMILAAGVGYGIIVLTISYIYGIINTLRANNKEEGLFGKNGITGYIFFMSFVFTILSVMGVVNVKISITLSIFVITLIIMVLKEPLMNLILGKKHLFHHSVGDYFTESIFEAVETILSALSNFISFVRVGAFALNHAGLFLAFMVISQMVDNIFIKIIVLVIGNILILTLEGLIVFIQGLRLQYYEMFSKYFRGGGSEFKPIKLKCKN